MQQTRARVFRGDTRFEGKIVSAFEPSAEVIRKGKAGKPNEFGKMVPAIATHRAKLGRVPRLVAADAALDSGNGGLIVTGAH